MRKNLDRRAALGARLVLRRVLAAGRIAGRAEDRLALTGAAVDPRGVDVDACPTRHIPSGDELERSDAQRRDQVCRAGALGPARRVSDGTDELHLPGDRRLHVQRARRLQLPGQRHGTERELGVEIILVVDVSHVRRHRGPLPRVRSRDLAGVDDAKVAPRVFDRDRPFVQERLEARLVGGRPFGHQRLLVAGRDGALGERRGVLPAVGHDALGDDGVATSGAKEEKKAGQTGWVHARHLAYRIRGCVATLPRKRMQGPRPPGSIKDTPQDFVVEELPAYAPSGEGTHVYVRFTKTDWTTLDAVRLIARALGCEPREAGFAGMKDKRAVATQTLSLQTPRGVDPRDLASRAASATLDGIVVHEATPHGHKMKPGHLAGNRFTIAVRDVPRDRLADVAAAMDRVSAEGVPNAFGAQRFGKQGDNAQRALAWLRGEERGPRDPRVQRLLWSALQSAVFNAVLDTRIAEGTFAVPLEGDC